MPRKYKEKTRENIGETFMTAKQIARYTALAKRYSEIVLASGNSWKPEYEEELQKLNREITNLRKEMSNS